VNTHSHPSPENGPASPACHVSARAAGLQLSALANCRSYAQRRGWTDVIPMAGAEIAFPAPPAVSTALERVVSDGFIRYGPVPGHADLLALLRDKLRRVNRIEASQEQVCCTPGSVSALHILLMVLIDPGDEVLIQDPCWDHFPEMIRLAGGRPKRFRMVGDGRGHFEPDFDHLQAQITPATRVALINTPLNPCGAVLRREEAHTLVEILDAHGIALISDEAYESFVFGDHVHFSPGEISPGAVTVHSFSKSFAVPGLRLASICAPPAINAAVRAACLYAHLVTSSVAQCVGLGILSSAYMSYVTAIRQCCTSRLAFLQRGLEASGLFRCRPLEGGLYLPATPLLADVAPSELTTRLFHDAHVIALPGATSGAMLDQDVCFFFGLEERVLAEGLERVVQTAQSIAGVTYNASASQPVWTHRPA
jgi:aspartate/methionine/tyrosine aminotransferase